MLKRMLDILVCPFDKESPLELIELKTKTFEKNDGENEIKDSKLSNTEQKDPINKDIVIEEGVLFCNNCFRFFPIVEEIPIILPDELRDKNKDIEMLNRWSNSLPDKIIKTGLPWHL
jgi:uncharacterized protein YbaR (Trm112 family)